MLINILTNISSGYKVLHELFVVPEPDMERLLWCRKERWFLLVKSLSIVLARRLPLIYSCYPLQLLTFSTVDN